MQCPVCDEKMREVEKFGVTIDICPGCKGVWLDRGELEKIMAMDRGESPMPEAARREEPRMERKEQYREEYRDNDRHRERDDRDRREHEYRRDSHGYGQGQGQKRRGSWIGDLLGGLGGDD